MKLLSPHTLLVKNNICSRVVLCDLDVFFDPKDIPSGIERKQKLNELQKVSATLMK